MVEFALILPIFVALVFGIISYGYMLSYRQGLSQAATEGARSAAVAPSGADREDRARTALNASLAAYDVACEGTALQRRGATVGSCIIDVADVCSGGRPCVTIDVNHNYRDHPLIPSFPGLGITLPEQLPYTAVVEVN